MAADRVLMTVDEYASHRGCSDSYIRRLRRQGRLVLGEDGKLIDVAASDAAIEQYRDPLRGGDHSAASAVPAGRNSAPRERLMSPAEAYIASACDIPAADAGLSLKEAVRRERLAKARLAELELGEAAGDLTRRAEVQRQVFTLARQALERMRTMGSRLRTRLAAESDARACEAIINAEIAEICEDMQRAADDLRNANLSTPPQEAA